MGGRAHPRTAGTNGSRQSTTKLSEPHQALLEEPDRGFRGRGLKQRAPLVSAMRGCDPELIASAGCANVNISLQHLFCQFILMGNVRYSFASSSLCHLLCSQSWLGLVHQLRTEGSEDLYILRP